MTNRVEVEVPAEIVPILTMWVDGLRQERRRQAHVADRQAIALKDLQWLAKQEGYEVDGRDVRATTVLAEDMAVVDREVVRIDMLLALLTRLVGLE